MAPPPSFGIPLPDLGGSTEPPMQRGYGPLPPEDTGYDTDYSGVIPPGMSTGEWQPKPAVEDPFAGTSPLRRKKKRSGLLKSGKGPVGPRRGRYPMP